MKSIYQFLLAVTLFTVVSEKAISQASNTGTWPPDFEVVEKCVDSSDLGTNYISYYEVQTHRAGFAVVVATYRANGSSFTVPSGKIQMGMCPQSVTVTKDSIRQFVIMQLCDATGTSTYVPFWRVIQRTYWPTTGAGTFNVLYTMDKNGASYTPSGSSNISELPCVPYEYPNTELRSEITTNVTYNSVMESWSVTNVGTSLITITLGAGSAVNMYPGETVQCADFMDYALHKLKLCSTFSVNATGGTAHVYYRTKP